LTGRGALERFQKLKVRLKATDGDRLAGPTEECTSIDALLEGFEVHLRPKVAKALASTGNADKAGRPAVTSRESFSTED
jgi:hypothetical protein